MAPSTQHGAVIHDVVYVTGGGITNNVGWAIGPITMVGGKKFGDMCPKARGCKQFLGDNFKMMQYIKNRRNEKVYELMQALSLEDDPNEENARIDTTVRLPKRELIDRLPPFITIDVTTATIVASVDVLPTWRDVGVLQIEMTQSNLDLLLESPPAETAPWKPEIEQQDVRWVGTRHHVRCRYWDSKLLKWRSKSTTVSGLSPNMDDEAKQGKVRRVAVEVQEFFDAHHNQGNNMPKSKRGRGSSDEESDCGEPVQKDSRTEAADIEYEP